MHFKSTVIFVLSLSFTISAQEWRWAKASGRSNFYEEGMNISTDKENNIYISGSSKTVCHRCPSYYFSILSKFDPVGNHLWTDTIPFYEQKSVTDPEGFTYVASGGRYAKYDKNGANVWQKDNSAERWNNLAIHPKGGFVASGSDPATQADALIARFDENGDLVWKRSGDTWAQCCAPDQIACDNQGNVYFTTGADTSQSYLNSFFSNSMKMVN